MLAYELYAANSEYDIVSGYGYPIKKIFVNNDNIQIDNTPIDKYASIDVPNKLKSFLQKNFDMPIDNNPKIFLPHKIVAPRSPKPYLKISGSIELKFKKINADSQSSTQISGHIILGKENPPYAKLSIPDYKQEILPADLNIEINKNDYFVGSDNLYDLYIKHNIIQSDKFPSHLFEKLASKFFEFIRNKKVTFPTGKTSFHIYVLPNNDKITYKNTKNIKKQKNISYENSKESIKIKENDLINKNDSFGNRPSGWSEETTQGVSFISFDDKAFTINCTKGSDFYKNLGIQKSSLDKIILPNYHMKNMFGLQWYFIDIKNPHRIFEGSNKGIYRQLYDNYSELNSTKDIDVNSNYKIICIKRSQSKFEVMISENITFQNQKLIFKNIRKNNVIDFAYELLIIKRGRSKIYRYYIRAIKSLLTQTNFDWNQLKKIFTDEIHYQIRDWLKPPYSEAKYFFKKSEFCYKTLNLSFTHTNSLDAANKFAQEVGMMARKYVDFRKEIKDYNNSINNLLSKPKYDVNTLKFVVKSIGRSIHLLNLTSDQYDRIRKKLSLIKLEYDDDLDRNNTDLSYHFYKGFFGETQ